MNEFQWQLVSNTFDKNDITKGNNAQNIKKAFSYNNNASVYKSAKFN